MSEEIKYNKVLVSDQKCVGVRSVTFSLEKLQPPQCDLLMLHDMLMNVEHTVTYLKRNLYRLQLSFTTFPYISVFFFPSEELQEAERLREEAESTGSLPPAAPRAQIPFSACMNALSEPETLTDFWSSAVQGKTTATKHVTFYT